MINIPEKTFIFIMEYSLQDNKYFLITSKKPINSYKFKLKDLRYQELKQFISYRYKIA